MAYRCDRCGKEWSDVDAATKEYSCTPKCGGHLLAPRFLPRAERVVLDWVVTEFPFPLAITYARLQEEMDREEPVAAV